MKSKSLTILALTLNICVSVNSTEEVNYPEINLDIIETPSGTFNLNASSHEINFGSIKNTDESVIILHVSNKIDRSIGLSPLRSPCNCISISGNMENNVTLDCNKTRDFNLTLDGKGYSGSFSKNLILRVERENGASQILSIPLRFSVHGPGTEPSPASTAVATQMEIRFTPYKGGGLEAYPEAVLWVFGADDCPGCNHLKATVLPDFLGQPSEGKAHEVIRVNLDDVDQFEFLMSLEDKMGISNPGDTPAILWKGRLIYGMDAIKKLVRKPSGGSS